MRVSQILTHSQIEHLETIAHIKGIEDAKVTITKKGKYQVLDASWLDVVAPFIIETIRAERLGLI